MVFQKKPKPTPATTDAELFEKEGHASQLEQYDYITDLNLFAVIPNYSAMKNDLLKGESNLKLYNDLTEYHKYFTALYGATYLELSKYLEIPYTENGITVGQKVRHFIDTLFVGEFQANHLADQKNRECLKDSINNAVEVFYLYQEAMEKGRYRKTTYKKMKDSERWRENF